MRKAMAGSLSAGALLVAGIAAPAAAAPPSHRQCPPGTEHAHATVGHETEGQHNAHQRIPHCPPGD